MSRVAELQRLTREYLKDEEFCEEYNRVRPVMVREPYENGYETDYSIFRRFQKEFFALTDTLDLYDIKAEQYTILGLRNLTICIIYEDGVWTVFNSGGLVRFDEKSTTLIRKACEFVMDFFAQDKEVLADMLECFDDTIEWYKSLGWR